MTTATKTKNDAVKEEGRGGRKVNPVDPAKVEQGHLMAFVYYAKVAAVPRAVGAYGKGERLDVRNVDTGDNFSVSGRDLVTGSYSADQYGEEVKVTKTQAAELLTTSFNRPFTVVFTKQDGEERTLRGRLVEPEPLLGRSHVEDLDLDKDARGGRLRLVDHRTIKSIVIEGVKYTVK